MKMTTFEVWMQQVDMLLEDELGTLSIDLPDMDYWSEWNNGTNPSGMVQLIKKDNGVNW